MSHVCLCNRSMSVSKIYLGKLPFVYGSSLSWFRNSCTHLIWPKEQTCCTSSGILWSAIRFSLSRKLKTIKQRAKSRDKIICQKVEGLELHEQVQLLSLHASPTWLSLVGCLPLDHALFVSAMNCIVQWVPIGRVIFVSLWDVSSLFYYILCVLGNFWPAF